MFEKLEDVQIRLEEIVQMLGDPATAGDAGKMQKLLKEQAELQPVAETYQKWKENRQTIAESTEMLEEEEDPEMRELLKEELREAKDREPGLEKQLQILLLPRDPNDEKNVIVELRAGAGGDEAALFASEIYRMYVTFKIIGRGAYSRMKYESGVHRVQRVPETESGGRIHTSTMTVAVMPEVTDDIEIDIPEKDVRIDVMRASGNGGQCVNTTDSAVRLTHYPTGIVIYSQTEKSQIQNKAKAWALLRAKLYFMEMQERHDREAQERRSQIGTGDRSEK